MNTSPSLSHPAVRWHMPVVLAFASVCFAAMWVFFAGATGSTLSWLAVLAAMDLAWFIRKLGWPYKDSRPVVTMLFTAATIALANYWMASVLYSLQHNPNILQALSHVGDPQILFKIRLMNTVTDWFWYAMALFIASMLASRPNRAT
ncbi:hypothetical protein V3390_00405 [Luteimonas sp. FXH3W]|uniref:Transmembrane protein n=1 Tax=Aquilutibacter rugosus TaxID=3115820 RepID=A0ABU7UVU2_9GAMM